MQEPIPNFLFYFPFFTLLNVKEKMSTVLVTIIVIWVLRFYVMYWKSTIIIVTNHQQHSKPWKELSAIEWRVINQTLICAVEKLTIIWEHGIGRSLNTWTGWCQWVRHKDWVIKGLIIPLKITYEQKAHQAM